MRVCRHPQLRMAVSMGQLAALILLVFGLAGCGRFTFKSAAEPPHPLWPQLGGSPTRNAAVTDEPVFPLRQLWVKRTMSGINPSLIGMEDWVLFGTQAGKVEGFNLRSGDALGKIIGRNTTAITCAWGSGLVVVKRLGAQNLFFYNLATGQKKWQKTIGAFLGEPLIVADRLYIATLRGRILCLALEDGHTLAETQLPHDCLATPAWADSILAVGDDRGTLYGFDARLRQRWQVETGAALRAPAVASQGLLFIGSTSGRFSALDAASGAPHWSFATSGKIFHAAAAADSLVILASTDHQVYALHREDGRIIWQFDLEAVPAAAPLLCGGTAFIGAANKKLFALSLADGHEQWSFTAKNRISSAPILLGNNLLFAAEDFFLYCFAIK